MYSNYFDSFSGVKQGEPLSPLLFIMFIDNMHGNLDINNIDTITVDDLNLFYCSSQMTQFAFPIA